MQAHGRAAAGPETPNVCGEEGPASRASGEELRKDGHADLQD